MRRLLLLAPLALAGCVAPQPDAPPMPRPVPAPVVPPAPAPGPPPAWQDGPPAPGDWRRATGGAGPAATFGVAQQPPSLTVRCDPARRTISLGVPGLAQPGATLVIEATDGTRSFPVVAGGTTPPSAVATTPAADPFLDRMAFSRGRFRIRLGTGSPVVIPTWPEFARTVQDCRS